MSRPDPGSEPSMDDILDSIRRIITEDPPGAGAEVDMPQQVVAQQQPTIATRSLPPTNANPATQGSAPMGDGLMPQTVQIDDDDILDLVEEAAPVASAQTAHAFGAEQAQMADRWQMPPAPNQEHDQAAVQVDEVSGGTPQPTLTMSELSNGPVPGVEDAVPHLDMPDVHAEPLVEDGLAADPGLAAEYEDPSASFGEPGDPVGGDTNLPKLNPHALPGPLAASEPTPLPFEFRSVGGDDGGAPSPFRADRLSDLLAATPDPSPSEALDDVLSVEPFEADGGDSTDDAPSQTPFQTLGAEPSAADVSPVVTAEAEPAVPSDDLGIAGGDLLPAEPEVLASMVPIEPIEAKPDATLPTEQDTSLDVGSALDAVTRVDLDAADDGNLSLQPVAAFDDGDLDPGAQPDYAAQQPETSSADAAHPEATISASAVAVSALSAGDVAAASEALSDAEGAKAPARSLEDVVIEAMRPMLQEWIDKNMPEMADKLLREFTAQNPTDEDTGN
jgi:hypothetical protein